MKNKFYKTLTLSLILIITFSLLIGVVTKASYYPDFAVLYANYVRATGNSYAEEANPEYKFFDDDSTNFVSQCAFMGGARISSDSSYKKYGRNPEKTLWYHVPVVSTKSLFTYKLYNYTRWKYSSTWHEAFSEDPNKGFGFYQVMVDYRGVAATECSTLNEVVSTAKKGDAIMVRPDGSTAGQMLLVTEDSETQKEDVLISAHSSNMKNVSFRDDIHAYYRVKNPNVNYVVIHVTDFEYLPFGY